MRRQTRAGGDVRASDLRPFFGRAGDLMPLCYVRNVDQVKGLHLAAGIIQQDHQRNHAVKAGRTLVSYFSTKGHT